MPIVTALAPAAQSSTPPPAARDHPMADERLATAREFEAMFIAEMLSHAGLEKAFASDAGFGGEAMSGLMIEELARRIADRGGFGVARLVAAQIEGKSHEIEP